jgi:N-acetylneuraminate synthase/sialic acid synthase
MARPLEIDGTRIDDASDAYVIAEIGHNHQGRLEQARELIRAAAEAGASAVKLQKRDNRALYTAECYHRPYHGENSFGRTYGEHREALEFGRAEYEELIAYSREIGITLFATAFDFPSADFLADLDVPAFKVASGDVRNIPLIRYLARCGKPLLVSTGGSTMVDVQRAYGAAREHADDVAILQCTATYPARPEELDLRVISTYRKRFPVAVVGLSDHDEGTVASVGAYVLGARIFEKHFTLDRTMKGTDHRFSLEPHQLREMVTGLRHLRRSLGSEDKRIHPSEKPAIDKMGKHLVAVRDLPAGHLLTRDCIAIKSPAGPLPPTAIEHLIGQRVTRPMKRDEAFDVTMLASIRRAA